MKDTDLKKILLIKQTKLNYEKEIWGFNTSEKHTDLAPQTR